jgi:hypothetical protein
VMDNSIIINPNVSHKTTLVFGLKSIDPHIQNFKNRKNKAPEGKDITPHYSSIGKMYRRRN